MIEQIKPWVGLLSAVLGSFGGAIIIARTWDDVLTPQGIGGIIVSLAGALGSWFSPLPNEKRNSA